MFAKNATLLVVLTLTALLVGAEETKRTSFTPVRETGEFHSSRRTPEQVQRIKDHTEAMHDARETQRKKFHDSVDDRVRLFHEVKQELAVDEAMQKDADGRPLPYPKLPHQGLGEMLEDDPNHPNYKGDKSVLNDPAHDDNKRRVPPTPSAPGYEPELPHEVKEEKMPPPHYAVNLVENQTSLEEALKRAEPLRLALFVHDSVGCGECDDFLPEFVEIARQFAESEANLTTKQRTYYFAYTDVGKRPEDLTVLKSKSQFINWLPPFVVVMEQRDINTKNMQPNVFPYDRQMKQHLVHYLKRLTAHDGRLLRSEEDLMESIYDTPNDDVVIVMFHDVHDRDSRNIGWHWKTFHEVSHDEQHHVHFAYVSVAGMGTREKADEYPDPAWIAQYNPDDCDVVGFVAVSGESFRSYCFNFTMDDYSPQTHFKGVLALREFVDGMKLHRNPASGRHWRGFSKEIEYAPKANGHKVMNPKRNWCNRPVEAGDTISLTVVATSLDHGHDHVFLNWTEPVDVVVGSDTRVPHALQKRLVGLCERETRHLFLPPQLGFHAEHFLYTVHHIKPVKVAPEHLGQELGQPVFGDEDDSAIQTDPNYRMHSEEL